LGEFGAGGSSHRLTADQLDLVGRATRAAGGDLAAGVRRLAAGRIDQLALKVRPTRRWPDLVLPADRLAQVREVAVRYRHRELVFGTWRFSAQPSAGVIALFAGPSGTGKTLAAEIIAGDLGLDLYKVDLANLVSKYIGETEKNLSQVFDAAEASNVVLFFDEADALLGKRSEVSDAHDRYANIEVAYLLQRLERHNGLVVLATNLPKNIDAAFARRIHVSIDFPMPEEAERRRIWDQAIPAAAPVADLDVEFLASRFELSGGSIRNVALSAAFLAAEAGTAITMAAVLLAVQAELHKLGRLVASEDFGDYAPCLEAARR
jgi:SpoVK/Ycf46/Vps4 family AAA+-type ATPase